MLRLLEVAVWLAIAWCVFVFASLLKTALPGIVHDLGRITRAAWQVWVQ